jgi:hypothetical protein
LASAFVGSISAGKGYSDLEVLSTRLQALALGFGILFGYRPKTVVRNPY